MIDNRGKAILTGLFFSKFDKQGLTALGFTSFNEAYNVLGLSINVRPSSIKNYRDEFDPFFPNKRQGWHNRSIRDYCKNYLDLYQNTSFDDFLNLVKSFIFPNFELEQFIDEEIERRDILDSVAKRLITGKAAEEYFRKNYRLVNQFECFDLEDATSLACGFDFKLTNNMDYWCVEVKGLSQKTGSILLTEKEFAIANKLQNQYCLFIVSNFVDKPQHKFFFNPLHCGLSFTKNERSIIQINYSTFV
jgi:hypothetical protein